MRSPRLHVETPLAAGTWLELGPDRTHYLLRVLRLRPGAEVRVFNARDGEWSARIEGSGQRPVTLLVGERLRPPVISSGPTLFVAPPKRIRFEWLVEKTTELGVGRIVPVATRRTVAKPERADRLRLIAVEAAEQCERLDVPEIEPLCGWEAFLGRLGGRPLLFADEAGGQPLLPVLAAHPDAMLLVGPEGGFDPAEREALRARSGVVPVTLGPRVLRVETAAVAMLACRQASLDAEGRGC